MGAQIQAEAKIVSLSVGEALRVLKGKREEMK